MCARLLYIAGEMYKNGQGVAEDQDMTEASYYTATKKEQNWVQIVSQQEHTIVNTFNHRYSCTSVCREFQVTPLLSITWDDTIATSLVKEQSFEKASKQLHVQTGS